MAVVRYVESYFDMSLLVYLSEAMDYKFKPCDLRIILTEATCLKWIIGYVILLLCQIFVAEHSLPEFVGHWNG